MDDFRQACGGVVTSVVFPLIVTTAFGFFAGVQVKLLFSFFRKLLGVRKSNSPSNEKEVIEAQKTLLQVAKEWIEMTKLVSQIQDDQRNFVHRFHTLFEAKCAMLGQNVTQCLEEKFLKHDEEFTKMKQTMEFMQEEILTMKDFLQTLVQKSFDVLTEKSDEKEENQVVFQDSFAQTEYEMKRKGREGNLKNGFNSKYEALDVVAMVKKCLADLLNDAKLQISIEREDESKELELILARLAEDREDIKKTIVQAFTIVAEQEKKNFDEFGRIGQEAVHYVSMLNDNTNKRLKTKLDVADDRLKEILNAVSQGFDINRVTKSLEHIDYQIDGLYQRIEVGYRKNEGNCDEIVQSLEKASSRWEGTVEEMENMAKELAGDAKTLKEVLKEMKNLINTLKVRGIDSLQERNETVQYDNLVESKVAQNIPMLPQKQKNVYSMVQSCWETVLNTNTKVESGCETITKLIDTLEQKLRSINECVLKLDEVVKSVNLESLANYAVWVMYNDAIAEGAAEDIAQESSGGGGIGNAGDGLPHIFHNRPTSASLAHKIQSAMAIDKEVKMIEVILRKLSEKRELNYISTSAPVRPSQEQVSDKLEESASTLTADKENERHDVMEIDQNNKDDNARTDVLEKE